MDKKIKRPNFFRDGYEKEFHGLKQSLKKGQCFAHCSFCNCAIKLEAIRQLFLPSMQLKNTRTLLKELSQTNL